MTHPHAEILRAIADGVPLSEFEAKHSLTAHWIDPTSCDFASDPANWQVRRKPRIHVVNGFTVPEPMDRAPEVGSTIYEACPGNIRFADEQVWDGYSYDARAIKRGLYFATKEAAIANAKAMLKIDPEAA